MSKRASHADPRTTIRYDRARGSLDRHATYIVAAYIAGQPDQPHQQAVAALARELGDPVRLAVADILAGGPRTASQLASELAIAAPRLANHLTRLRAAGIVAVTRSGRHAIYRLADPRISDVLRVLHAIVPGGGTLTPAEPEPDPMTQARTCYDHIAGRLGVAVFDHLVAAGALLAPPAADNAPVTLGPDAARAFASLGVDIGAPLPRRRKPATACLDWTERRPHLGGALGAAVLDSALARGWVRKTGDRTLTITPAGRKALPRTPR
jgi:DNA-binding transcriptional ArsR family regulator